MCGYYGEVHLDGWLILGFMTLSKVFQSFRDNNTMILKGKVVCNKTPFIAGRIPPPVGFESFPLER